MALILHFYQYAEIYSIVFAWFTIPCAHFALYLWIKNNSYEESVKGVEGPVVSVISQPETSAVAEKVAA